VKPYFASFLTLFLILGCSQDISESLSNPLVITSEREIISDLDSLENHLFQSLNKSSVQNISIEDVFEDSWLSSIKTDYSIDRPVSVEIKEHHPIANIGRDRYLTQRGKSINPKGQFKQLSIISINGPEDLLSNLINLSRELQTKLNKLDLRVISFELRNKDQLKAKDDSGTEYIFSKKEFRVQLERLEDYISFELNSGKGNHIRYIDFRYNNAIAVYHS
jgi:cell division septal protein FtsQ